MLIAVIVIVLLFVLAGAFYYVYSRKPSSHQFAGYYEQDGQQNSSQFVLTSLDENGATVYSGSGTDIGLYSIKGNYVNSADARLPDNGEFEFVKKYSDYDVIYKGQITDSVFTGGWRVKDAPTLPF